VRWGIKKRTNEEGRKQYIAEAQGLIKQFGLTEPDQMKGRRFV
jgi:1,2-phenylacetyl-CoA epoxidase catalytic subunit